MAILLIGAKLMDLQKIKKTMSEAPKNFSSDEQREEQLAQKTGRYPKGQEPSVLKYLGYEDVLDRETKELKNAIAEVTDNIIKLD